MGSASVAATSTGRTERSAFGMPAQEDIVASLECYVMAVPFSYQLWLRIHGPVIAFTLLYPMCRGS